MTTTADHSEPENTWLKSRPAVYGPWQKARFVAATLPVLAVLGAILRIVGLPQVPTLVTVSVLLLVGFLVSITSAALDSRQRDADAVAQARWRERDLLWQEEWKAKIADQLIELADRHRQEEAELVRRGSSTSKEELTAMIERHNEEWDKLFRRHSA